MFNTAIIGLGQIGQGYDYSLNSDKYVLTHAQAVQNHPEFKLVAGIDLLEINRNKFEKKFKKPSFKNLDELNTDLDIDIIVVSVPTKIHSKIVKKIISQYSPKIILIEKPFSSSLKDAKELLKLEKEKNFSIAVNYIREFEPSHRTFIKRINNGELGFPLKIVCWYSKGLINNGSHFIQFISNILGDPKNINIIDKGRRFNDYDFEPSCEIQYENGTVYFIPVKEEDYTLFEMELIGTKGKIKYYNGGSHYDWWRTSNDPTFKDYKKLEVNPLTTKMEINKYQYHVYSNISSYLKGFSSLNCDGAAALKTTQILNQIQKKRSNER